MMKNILDLSQRVSKAGEVLETFGCDAGEPFYLRSCEKPLQASLAIDYELDLTDKELALACGSNAGENVIMKLQGALQINME